MKASEFLPLIEDTSLPRYPNREEIIFGAVLCGHFVHWPMVQVGSILVSSDYFSIGEEDDFVRVPCSLLLCQKIGTLLGYRLPTVTEVDAIWKAADVQLVPQAMVPREGYSYDSKSMCSVERFKIHNDWIEQGHHHAEGRNGRTGLIAGHKKDVVVSSRSGLVTIYGWHNLSGKPIQPEYPNESTPSHVGHSDKYADYSHGYRFVVDVIEARETMPSVVYVPT